MQKRWKECITLILSYRHGGLVSFMPKPLAEVAKNKGIEQTQGIYDKQFLLNKVFGQHSKSMSTVVGALWMALSLVRKVL